MRKSKSKGARGPQFELYRELTERGVRCECEVRLPAPAMRSGHFFADVGVYRGKTLVALCECKSRTRELRGRQKANYEGTGLPYIVAGNDNVLDAADWLEERAR